MIEMYVNLEVKIKFVDNESLN